MDAVEEVRKWCKGDRKRMVDLEEEISTSISPFLSEALTALEEFLEGKESREVVLSWCNDLFSYTLDAAEAIVDEYWKIPSTLVRWVSYVANAYWLVHTEQYEEALKELEKMADEVYPVWEWLRKELRLEGGEENVEGQN